MDGPKLTRQNLYELVWSKPMTHIARDFKMTDTGIRKYCKRHDIPTPTAGYWAKLEYGKPVVKKPLLVNDRAADEPIHLIGIPRRSIETVQAIHKADAKQEEIQEVLTVPDVLPSKPHSTIRAVRAALRKKPDQHGFINLEEANLPEISIGKASIPRALLLMQTLFTYAEKTGHVFTTQNTKFCWVVNGEPFRFRFYEAKNQETHKPTREDLQKQTNHDRWTDDGKQVYRKWDYVPSGKLAIALHDTNGYQWSNDKLAKRWADRKSNALETFLAEIFIWLEPASIMARERRLVREEKERIAFEERERDRIYRERLVTTKKLQKYLDGLADIYSQANKISELITFFIKQKHADSITIQRMIDEANSYQEYLHKRLDDSTISADIENIGIDFDDDELYMPVLAIPVLHAWDYR